MSRHHRSAAIILLDLDGFKAVNDTHGHALGDDVLQRCAQVLRDEMRSGDVFARWGGEEFIAFLPDTQAGDAAATAERYRIAVAAVAAPSWPAGMTITASFGVADFGLPAAFDDALAAADEALYRAKADGRNRVCLAPTTAPPS